MLDPRRNYNEECKDKQNVYNYNFDDKMNVKKMQMLCELIDTDKVGRVLEVGCFEGGMTKLLNTHFKHVDVVEPSTECIRFMKEQGYTNTFIHTLLQDYVTDIKYDLIIISHTLEHIENQVEALKKAKTLLSENGYLYVVVPNGTSISRLIAVELGIVEHPCAVTPGEKEHGHYITYDKYTLERHMWDAGLSLTNSGGIVLKIFGNKQYDLSFKENIIDDKFIDACYELGKSRPLDCSSIYTLCKK